MDEFGEEELRTWYFEVWNEPDGMLFKNMPVFLETYDIFAHIVKSATRLKLDKVDIQPLQGCDSFISFYPVFHTGLLKIKPLSGYCL